jgi:hypothetical protein
LSTNDNISTLSYVSPDLTTTNDIHIADNDVTALLSISSSIQSAINYDHDDDKVQVIHQPIIPRHLSPPSNNDTDPDKQNSPTAIDMNEDNGELISISPDHKEESCHIVSSQHKAETNKTSKHNSKLKSTSKCPLKSKHQLPTSKSEGSSTKHSTPAPPSYDSLYDKSPYRNEQGITKCVYCSDWFRPTDDSIISACGKITHAVHFTCWERFYHQSHRTQRNKCPYGCHEHGAFVPVKLKWCGMNDVGGVKRKLEDQDNSKCEVQTYNKRARRTIHMEFDDPAITFIEQIQSGDNETKQLFSLFVQQLSSQLINHVHELSNSGIVELNVKGISAMTIPTPSNE